MPRQEGKAKAVQLEPLHLPVGKQAWRSIIGVHPQMHTEHHVECSCQSTTGYGPSRSELRVSGVAPKSMMGATIQERTRKKRPWLETETRERIVQNDCRLAHIEKGRSLRGAAMKQEGKNAQSDGTATIDVRDCSSLPLVDQCCFEGVLTHCGQLNELQDQWLVKGGCWVEDQ